MARAAGATAVGITAGFVGSSTTDAVSSSTNVAAAEQVATHFVTEFEGFSSRHPTARTNLAPLATASLAGRLSSPSQAATGPGLAAEHFTVTAQVVGFDVELDEPSSVELLARTDVRVSTSAGSSSTVRLIPVSLSLVSTVWKVSAIDGLTSAPPDPRSGGPGVSLPTGLAPPADSALPTSTATAEPLAPAPGSEATTVGDVPPVYLADMRAAVAAQCPGLSWTVLAGIGKVESDFGRSTLPGVTSGANRLGAEGPMQFEPATFATYGMAAPGGADPASPYDPADAIFSAATLLCADGGGNPAHLYSAIFDYNHSDAYVTLVLAYADEYGRLASGGSAADERGLGSVIVADAESYLGTEYVWGGENPRTGFDCSGLVQWVYAQAGLSLPRVAQSQYDAGPRLPVGATLYAGDLVFFGPGSSGVEHVGIYVGNGTMIDAPHTGAVVRFDRVASVPLSFVGATRPEIPDLTMGAGLPVVATYARPSGEGHNPTTTTHEGAGSHHRRLGGTGRHIGTRHAGSTSSGRHGPGTKTTVASTTPPHPGHRHPTTTTTTAPTATTTPTTTPNGTHRHHPTTTTTVPSTSTTTAVTSTTTPTSTTTSTAATTTSTITSTTTSGVHSGRHHKAG